MLFYVVVSLSRLIRKVENMQNWLKTLIAGGIAWKWGGGCLGTIVLFVVIYWLLGQSGC
jgi:uncharacterized membrane protein YdcZ (DUF606 family)